MPYELISVDDHIIEPPDVWEGRLPSKYKDQTPRVIEEDGAEAWLIDGQKSGTMGLNAVAGRPQEEWDFDPVRYTDMIEACYNPTTRAKEMEADGVVATVCFPTILGFAGSRLISFKDKELALLICQTYNDWLFDSWCAAAPDMYIPMVVVPLWDPVLAAAEIRRTAAMGARAITFPEETGGLGLPNFWGEHWDPMFQALEETGLVINCHVNTGGNLAMMPGAPFHVAIMLAQVTAACALVNLLESPILKKFPKLQWVYSEGGLGWIPAQLERADRMWERHHHWARLDGMLPSERFQQNCYGTFVDDQVGVDERYRIGVDRIMWESDFPHVETPWPESQSVVGRMLKDVPDEEAQLLTSGNARRLYNWPKKSK